LVGFEARLKSKAFSSKYTQTPLYIPADARTFPALDTALKNEGTICAKLLANHALFL
jgi:hypothetical protein